MKALLHALDARGPFAIVSTVLVALVVAAAWLAAGRFASVSAIVGERVADNGAEMASLDRLEAALGTEDDALVYALTQGEGRAKLLVEPRANLDASFLALQAQLEGAEEHRAAEELRVHVRAYRRGIDKAIAISAGPPAPLESYYAEALPELRRALASASRMRQDRFRSTQSVATWAQGEAARARGHVGLAALLVVTLVVGGAAWLARREMFRAKNVTELARRDELRSELLAVASHELRTPLTTLRLTLPMLEEASTPERERALLAIARAGCDQLSTTIEEFLDFARVEAGRLDLARALVDVGSIVDDVVHAMRVRADDAAIRIAIQRPSRAVTATGDRERLRAAVANVVANALAYTPSDGEVFVTLEAEEERLVVRVRDTGPGIPAELRERVFEKFFRVEHLEAFAKGRVTGGTRRGAGIGLYVSRQIVEAHGGVIRCDASRVGETGACFTIELPLNRA